MKIGQMADNVRSEYSIAQAKMIILDVFLIAVYIHISGYRCRFIKGH